MSLINKLPSFYGNNITKSIQNSLDIEAVLENDDLYEQFATLYVPNTLFLIASSGEASMSGTCL